MKNDKFNLNNKNISKIRIIPVITYTNMDTDIFRIYMENKNKSYIFRLVNKINDKNYVGSSMCLSDKINIFYSLNSYIKIKGSITIFSALFKYGYSNFSLDIVEYCESSVLISRKQYYIDNLKPEYNIKVAVGKS